MLNEIFVSIGFGLVELGLKGTPVVEIANLFMDVFLLCCQFKSRNSE